MILQNSNIDTLDFDDSVDTNYDVDLDGTLETDDQDGVVVPENRIKFSDQDIRALKLAINPLGSSDNHGVDIYEETLQYISLYINPSVIFWFIIIIIKFRYMIS